MVYLKSSLLYNSYTIHNYGENTELFNHINTSLWLCESDKGKHNKGHDDI